MKNLNNLFNECMAEARSIGIQPGNIVSVTVNTRAKSRWGQAKRTGSVYSINISDRILADELDDMAAKNTIMHEILHTCPGCMNHGPEWKRMADKVNKAYPAYNIQRTTSCADKGVAPAPARADRWEVKCVECGHSYKYKRWSKVCENPSGYRCGKCHGNLKVISLVPGVEIWGR